MKKEKYIKENHKNLMELGFFSKGKIHGYIYYNLDNNNIYYTYYYGDVYNNNKPVCQFFKNSILKIDIKAVDFKKIIEWV